MDSIYFTGIFCEAHSGTHISEVTQDICFLSKQLGINVYTTFNGILIEATKDSDPVQVTKDTFLKIRKGE